MFAVAALVEIGGCFAFWVWISRGASPVVLVLGVASLIGFALALARADSAFAGRSYAAYGGIYIAASLVWANSQSGFGVLGSRAFGIGRFRWRGAR
jgi:small multidrug resistance family-3 protein